MYARRSARNLFKYSCSRQLSKRRVWNVDEHKYRVLRGRSDRNYGWWWIYASGARAGSKNPTRRQKHPRATQGPSRDHIFRSLKLQIDIKSKLIYWVVLFMAGLLEWFLSDECRRRLFGFGFYDSWSFNKSCQKIYGRANVNASNYRKYMFKFIIA